MKLASFILSFLLFPLLSNTSNLTNEQKRQIDVCIDAFINNSKLYCNDLNSDKINLRTNFNQFIPEPETTPHVKDIDLLADNYDESNDDGKLTQPFSEYLRAIASKYDFKVNVEFSNKKILECVDKDKGIISLDKTITYNGSSKTFNEIMLINLPRNENDGAGYTISEIMTSEIYKISNTECSDLITVSKDKTELLIKRKEAERYFFELNDYLTAQHLFESILKIDPSDRYSQNKVIFCREKLTRVNYLTKANFYFDKKAYEIAINWYKRLLLEYPMDNDRQKIQTKIYIAQQAIIDLKYQDYLQKAEESFEQHNFNNSRYYYEQALNLKPNDRKATGGLERAKVEDDNYASTEINRVIQLANQGSRYFGEYFKILMKYEGYGNHIRLHSKQYYNMVLLLNNYDSHVMSEMHFSRKDCRSYCRIYCKKLNDLYYNESDANMKEGIRHLLTNVINSRNQN
jgi:tetratricopeptide (TPR) repeat protein